VLGSDASPCGAARNVCCDGVGTERNSIRDVGCAERVMCHSFRRNIVNATGE
jgi:hypothetical protein